MIKVINEVEPYEINGNELHEVKSKKQLLMVESHWNRREFVVLTFGDINLTVKASDVIQAVNNASNSNK
jgi:hypothetical protein